MQILDKEKISNIVMDNQFSYPYKVGAGSISMQAFGELLLPRFIRIEKVGNDVFEQLCAMYLKTFIELNERCSKKQFFSLFGSLQVKEAKPTVHLLNELKIIIPKSREWDIEQLRYYANASYYYIEMKAKKNVLCMAITDKEAYIFIGFVNIDKKYPFSKIVKELKNDSENSRLTSVKKRPGMYIGEINETGIHRLVYELTKEILGCLKKRELEIELSSNDIVFQSKYEIVNDNWIQCSNLVIAAALCKSYIIKTRTKQYLYQNKEHFEKEVFHNGFYCKFTFDESIISNQNYMYSVYYDTLQKYCYLYPNTKIWLKDDQNMNVFGSERGFSDLLELVHYHSFEGECFKKAKTIYYEDDIFSIIFVYKETLVSNIAKKQLHFVNGEEVCAGDHVSLLQEMFKNRNVDYVCQLTFPLVSYYGSFRNNVNTLALCDTIKEFIEKNIEWK